MKRREFIALAVGAAAAISTKPLGAQQAPRVVIGVLHANSEAVTSKQLGAFKAAMRQLGYVEGNNVHFEHRFADGVLERLPDLAAELVQMNPRIIVSAPVPANLAARKATRTIPIVMAGRSSWLWLGGELVPSRRQRDRAHEFRRRSGSKAA